MFLCCSTLSLNPVIKLCPREAKENKAERKGKKTAPDVNMDDFCGMIKYSSCAGLETILNEAAIAAACARRDSIEHDFNLVSAAEEESLTGGNASGRVQR